MKLSRQYVLMIGFLCCLSAIAAAASKENEIDGKKVDSGSFGIFQNGHRVGTETFSIYETKGGSVIRSEFKTDNAPGTQAEQNSELVLSGGGDIVRYDWHEVSPGKAESVVLPNEEFLVQKLRSSPQDKEIEQPYLLSHSTSVLDDYFFIHREVLVWRFLAAACKQNQGQVQCPVKQRTQFPTLNPHQHSSAPLTAEFVGREKMMFKGTQQEFNKVEFRTEAGNWQIWLDDQFRVMHMFIDTDNTEVVRD